MIANHVMDVAVYGASGHGRAVADMLGRSNALGERCKVVAFIDDTPEKIGQEMNGIPVLSLEHWRASHSDVPCFVSPGQTATRRLLVNRVLEAGGHFVCMYSNPPAVSAGFQIGVASGVWAPVYVGPDVKVGNHVQVMPMSSLGHDIRIGDFVTICPGCIISGHVVIEEGAYIGAGTVVTNGSEDKPLVIGRDAKVGAASFVSKSVPRTAKVAGYPARPLRELFAKRA